MKVGERVIFPFAGGEKEGIIIKVTPKKVYIKTDFPRHKGKIIKRSIFEVKTK